MSDEPVPIAAACADAVRRMWQLLDGDLDAVEHAEVDAHLAWCLHCCGELAFARELQHLLRTRTDVALPKDVEQRFERFIDGLDDTSDGVVPT